MLSFLKRNLFLLLIIPVVGVFLVISNHKIPDGERKEPESVEQTKPISDSATVSSVFVDVKGAVRNPGICKVSSDSRVNDVIQQAGGFSIDADQKMVNLAQKVQDEMMIVVPVIGENQANDLQVLQKSGRVRINYASIEEIETLNGIGPSKARAIIQYRDENGLFQSAEDLLDVPGIGEKTLDNLRDSIQVP